MASETRPWSSPLPFPPRELHFPGQPLPWAVHGARAGTGFLLPSRGAGGSVPCRALRLAAGRRMGRLSSQSAAFTLDTGTGRLVCVCVAGSSAFEAAQWESSSSKMVTGFNLPTRCKNKVTRARDWRAKSKELRRSGNHMERFEMRNVNLLVQAGELGSSAMITAVLGVGGKRREKRGSSWLAWDGVARGYCCPWAGDGEPGRGG